MFVSGILYGSIPDATHQEPTDVVLSYSQGKQFLIIILLLSQSRNNNRILPSFVPYIHLKCYLYLSLICMAS